jgi:hypothetical protein
VKRVLRVLGLVSGIGPLLMVLRTSWDSFDAYGTVSKGETRTLALPAGPIAVSFESSSQYAEGVVEDMPTITTSGGGRVPVEFMGQFQGPRLMHRSEHEADKVRKRFATAEIPADGEYVVTAAACTVLIGTAGFSRKPRAVPTPAGAEVAS